MLKLFAISSHNQDMAKQNLDIQQIYHRVDWHLY